MTPPHGGSRLGTRFGPYELNSLIGVGGMGEVYRAYDTIKDRTVAVKVLRAEMAADPNYQERFRRESRVAARLQEPHVIPVHDFGDIDGVLYIDMRLVEGGSLKDELKANGPLDPSRAASIIAQVAAALDAAHADGLVHRDIKPENVLLNADDFAYLVDFGIAHGGGDASMTMTGLIIGSCAYMSAERFSGGLVGPPADVYSLTCLLYESLTGRPPFETGDLRQLMTAHMFSPPPRPSIMRRGINRAFDDVIAKGMAKKPAERFASAGELAKAATAAALGGPVPPAPAALPSPPASTRQFSAVYPNPAGTGTRRTRRRRFAHLSRRRADRVSAQPGGAGRRDDRAVRRGRGPRDAADERRPGQRRTAADHDGGAAAVGEHGNRDGLAVDVAVAVIDHRPDHDGTVDERDAAARRVGDRCAGLRRSCSPMRRGKQAGRGDQDSEVIGGDL